MMTRILLAYSGGFDTSVAIPWLRDAYDAEIVAVTVDVGQGLELAAIHERALSLGAVRAHVLDGREEFVREYILPALQAGAVYEDRYPLATALARPLIAKRLVEIARMEGASAIAHGCTSVHNDQVRLETSIRALAPSLEIIAAAQVCGMSRDDQRAFIERRRLPLADTEPAGYSIDTNLWGRAIASGGLEDAWLEPPEDIYVLTRAAQDCPNEPAYIELDFESGVPVRANGIAMALPELIESLETIGGAHGVGRIDVVENRLAGVKGREVYEAPAAVVLHAAHREMEKLVIPRELERVKRDLSRIYADLVYNGLWFSHTRQTIDAFVAAVQPRVTGSVRLKLFKGDCRIVGRKSPFWSASSDPVTSAPAALQAF
jgi:argininosuccinate synthase